MSVALLIMAASAGQAAVEYTAPHEPVEDAPKLRRMYPPRALQEGRSAAALMDLQVDPEGRVTACRTIAIYGSDELGGRICGLRKRVPIEPATINGQPAYGGIRSFVSYYLPGEKEGREVASIRPVADAEFTVASLPDGKEDLSLKLSLLVAPDGAIERCKGSTDEYPAFANTACSQIAKVKFQPLKDSAGVPVQHVRGFTAEFSLAK